MIHIVDDNESVLSVMIELVELFDYKARGFSSSCEYMTLAQSPSYEVPEAIFCDVLMPGLDGFELMRRVHALHPRIRFIIISGEDHTLHADKQGACIYLLKPIHFDVLENTFDHLRQCSQCGPSHDLVEQWPDDRHNFGVKTTTCPFTATDLI
ncbi:MAG: response regulator [Mariprofundaceae bacterium]|nr:response regulator [Mariprofundaceae bacterium]